MHLKVVEIPPDNTNIDANVLLRALVENQGKAITTISKDSRKIMRALLAITAGRYEIRTRTEPGRFTAWIVERGDLAIDEGKVLRIAEELMVNGRVQAQSMYHAIGSRDYSAKVLVGRVLRNNGWKRRQARAFGEIRWFWFKLTETPMQAVCSATVTA